jgi:hypothetical protein
MTEYQRTQYRTDAAHGESACQQSGLADSPFAPDCFPFINCHQEKGDDIPYDKYVDPLFHANSLYYTGPMPVPFLLNYVQTPFSQRKPSR